MQFSGHLSMAFVCVLLAVIPNHQRVYCGHEINLVDILRPRQNARHFAGGTEFLWEKLLHMIKHNHISISTLSGLLRKHRVKIMGKYSDWATTNRGVPHVSVLGPLLFNIFYQWFVLYKYNLWNSKLCWWQPVMMTICTMKTNVMMFWKMFSKTMLIPLLPGLMITTCVRIPINSRVLYWTEMARNHFLSRSRTIHRPQKVYEHQRQREIRGDHQIRITISREPNIVGCWNLKRFYITWSIKRTSHSSK